MEARRRLKRFRWERWTLDKGHQPTTYFMMLGTLVDATGGGKGDHTEFASPLQTKLY